MKKLLLIIGLVVICSIYTTNNVFSHQPLVLMGEEDGNPDDVACYKILVANGNLIDNGDGTCSQADQGGGEGSGTMTTVKENDVAVGGADIVILDFLGADFNLTEDPDKEIQIVIEDGGIDHDATANFVQNEHILVGALDHDALLNFASNEHIAEGTIDHGSIAGLSDDDHTQYHLTDGTRAMTGDLTLANAEFIDNDTNGEIKFCGSGETYNQCLVIDTNDQFFVALSQETIDGSSAGIQFKSALAMSNDVNITLGNQSRHFLNFDTGGTDALKLRLSNEGSDGRGSGYLLVTHRNSSPDPDDVVVNPTLGVTSSESTFAQRMEFSHSSNNGYINIPTGNVILADRSSLDAEKITNGTFTGNADSWTLNTGWTYTANTVDKDGDGTGTLLQTSANMQSVLVAGEVYLLQFTTTDWTVGTITPAVGGVTGIAIQPGNDGTITFNYMFKATDTSDLTFTPSNTARFTIDSIVLKKINDGDLNVIGTMEAGVITEGGVAVHNVTQSDAAYQPLDAELTTIAGLTETTGNVMIAVSSAWASVAAPIIDCTNCTNIPSGSSHTGTVTWAGTSILESGAAFQFGDGTDATVTHTYGNTGTDVVIAYSTAAMAVTGALTATNLSGTNTGDSHTVASHSDTSATGAELNELTDASETTLHSHAGGGAEFHNFSLAAAKITGTHAVGDPVISGGDPTHHVQLDAATDDAFPLVPFIMPAGYTTDSLDIVVTYSMSDSNCDGSATVVGIEVDLMAVADGEDATGDSFDTINQVAGGTVCPGTADLRDTITFANINDDGLAAGETVIIRINRDVDDDDDAADIVQILDVQARWNN